MLEAGACEGGGGGREPTGVAAGWSEIGAVQRARAEVG